nr:unnamed protein product [Callosobruchus analis]
MFSSGTTGLPKGICLNHYALLKQSWSVRDHDAEGVDSVVLLYSTLIWISSVTALIGTTPKGEARILCRKFDGKRFWEIIEKYKIVDLETEQPVTAPNMKGELHLKSDLVMNGYYKMDSSDVFYSDGYLKTGDVVYCDEDNCLFIADRVKESFKYRGWQILPAILEDVLMRHSAVKEAAVIGIPRPGEGDHPMGLVVLKKGCENVTPEEIREFADEKLSHAQKLRAVVRIVDELVKTPTGKVKRKALREMILSNTKQGGE